MKFFRSVADEMKQVTWPTKKQLRKDTLVVIEHLFYLQHCSLSWILLSKRHLAGF